MKVRGKALLVGNGVNLAAKLRPGWDDVVKDIFALPRENELPARMQVTPFPLLVEEACTQAFTLAREREIQDKLAKELNDWEPADLHRDIVRAGCDHILTTNYDLVLEKASEGTFAPEPPFVEETRYSLYRRNVLRDGKRVWHIHGAITAPKTMVLGFEHYAGHLQALREAVVSGRPYAGKRYGPLKRVLRKGMSGPAESWPEVALTHHLQIIGSGLDFAELGLWWLLTYRNRALNAGKGVLPKTEVRYATRRDEPDPRGVLAARAALLEKSGVEVLQIAGEWSDVYRVALERFKSV